MGDMGDLSDFFKEGSGVADLDWLDVDEQAAREVATLPKQNLDFAPELAAQWNHEDKAPLAYFVPNRDMANVPKDEGVERAPNTMGDLSDMHGPLRMEPEDLMVRTARLALMESTDLSRWKERMFSKFARDQIAASKTALSGVLAERGLLGGYYIDAEDFPKCATSSTAQTFVQKHASGALFVKAKTACGDCTHAQGGRCGVFHKQLVPEVPYSDDLVQKVAGARSVTASTEGDPRSRIQSAILGAPAGTAKQAGFTGQGNQGAVIPASRLLKKGSDVRAQEEQLKEAKAKPIVAMVRRELLKGRGAEDVAKGLRLAFDPRDLKATAQYWGPVFKEAGLYGAVYSTQDSFADCHQGADFLSKHASKVRAIVAGDKCGSCIFNKVSSCMLYGRKLVASVDDIVTADTVAAVLDEHKMAGKISPYLVNQSWGETPREALKNIHKTATTGAPIDRIQQPRMDVATAFHGQSSAHVASDLAKREIVKVAAQYLNEGLYGQDLGRALMARFDQRDLAAAATTPELRAVMAEQGLQGIFFVDPSVYDDYGRGCKTAQRKYRTKAAIEYAKAGDKCATCVHQTRPGVCSVLNKKLAAEIPYLDRAAQQKAVLASGQATGITLESLVNTGTNIVQEFQLTGSTGQIDLNAEGESLVASIEFGTNEVDVNKL
jgi:hypothetical protein